jgi:2-oxo-4-hydroxy-4-carboxy-5-ureidoimidazoline decarboxylase
MNRALEQWNEADPATALAALMACCGARRWAAALVARRPFANTEELHGAADDAWHTMLEPDWLEAFACHPRIGERSQPHPNSQSSTWSSQEQASIQTAPSNTLSALAQSNAAYERKFGFTYIVCATGKAPEEMLAILHRRLAGDRESELRNAAEQQREIMHIRLRKWLEQ